MLVSFIVPCYNVSKWVTRCLDSIYALGFSEEEFEIITVDDASTDDTLSILESYADEHQNLKIVRHLVNRNLGAARNSGLSVSTGRYIIYVDSDDEIGPGMANAVRLAESSDLDMVATRIQSFSEQGVLLKEEFLSEPVDRIISGREFQTEHPFWYPSVCGYVFSSRLLDSVRYYFVEGAYYEDVDYLCRHLSGVKRMSYYDECGYKFYIHSDSITHSFSSRHVYGYVLLGFRMISLYESLEDKSSDFASSILEGGSYNIMRGFKYLLRLPSVSDVVKFYNLLDARVDRKQIPSYKVPAYCWTKWTKLGLRHRNTMVLVSGLLISLRFRDIVKRFS